MQKITKFQEILKEKNITAYIIPTGDFHNSEYISEYFKTRQFLSNFTGSAGTLIITQKEALLWVDGRYHIQAANEIENLPITLVKQGLDGTITITDYLNSVLKENDTLGFDGKILPANFTLDLLKKLPNINTSTNEDLVSLIWEDRPSLPTNLIFEYDTFFAGKSYQEKLDELRTKMSELNTDVHILTSLEDQAWLYNLRGNDIVHTPVFLAYSIINNDECHLFIDDKKIDKLVEKYLKDNNIITHPYLKFYDALKEIKNKKILLDYTKVNYTIFSKLKENNYLVNQTNPTILLKAIKNQTEIKNLKLAHIKDGVAFTKLMYHVKNNIKNTPMTEISVSNLLENFRKEQPGFVDISFNTICAYKEHAAMMHYSATEQTNFPLKQEGLLLIDSGGHYLEGTTDITRTLCLGNISKTMKLHFTTVLKSVIALSEAVFLKGTRGTNLDILARGPIWKLLIDYKCGTGHGVGHLLSVHEAPNGFRWQIVPERNDSHELLPGMVTTNEPGIYLENKYGIRIENELLCIRKTKNEFGEFFCFETVTYAPIDLDAVDTTLLTENEKAWINNYHNDVYNKLFPYLTKEESLWLKNAIKLK